MTQDKVKIFFDRPDYLKNSSDRIAIRSQIVKQFLGERSGVKILDIGCGDGSLSLPLLNESNHITLVDISDQMIAQARKNIPAPLIQNVALINGSFELVSEDSRFDIILCVGVIAHVPNVELLWRKIAAALKPGGLLIIETTPNPYPIGKLLFPYYFIRNRLSGRSARYSKNRVKVPNLLESAKGIGLELLNSARYSFPLPGMTHWSHEAKMRYTLFTLNNSFASRFGSEHIFLMQRNVAKANQS